VLWRLAPIKDRSTTLPERFLIGDSGPVHPVTLSHAFAAIADEVGLGDVRFHDLRHAFATTLLVAGVHPKVVSEALGHASTSFTMDTYQDVLPTMGAAVAAAIETALGERGRERWHLQ
jgi:integrase